ncbi:MAG: hypothetical protein KatS3mg065_1279 [Chloroflexota bacterium]|nr:MAG: hypothetical protein KatS3mg065_1279 [Chloroflexota bacterium]
MASRTAPARAEVLAARRALAEELGRTEAAVRAAVDIPTRIRNDPLRTIGLAGGFAFLVLRGPQRVARRLWRTLRGPAAALPPSLLPDEIERAVRALGEDGARVRGVLEREFARYLAERSKVRRREDLAATAATLLRNVAGPASRRLGRRLAESLFEADRSTLARWRERLGR